MILLRRIKYLLVALLILINPISGLLYGYLDEIGAFHQWESLGTPPEKPINILAAKLRGIGVDVITESGQIYECCNSENQSSWSKVSMDEVRVFNWIDCLNGGGDEGKRYLKDQIDHYAVYWCGEWDYGHAYYAIRRDGSVWAWKQSSDTFEMIIRLCGYPLIGLVMAILFGTAQKIIAPK